MRMAAGEREAVVDLGRPLERVLRPSAGSDEYRLVMRGAHQSDSPPSVGHRSERKVLARNVNKRWIIGMKNATAASVPKSRFSSRKVLLFMDLRE